MKFAYDGCRRASNEPGVDIGLKNEGGTMSRLVAGMAVFWMTTIVTGAEPQPLLTTLGKPLASEDFTGGSIPQSFRTLQSSASFRVVNGALEASYVRGQERSTHGVFMAKARDLTIEFAVKFVRPGATLYVGIDGYKESFQGNTHLVRFSLTPERMAWDQHRGSPESKHAVGEAMQAARQSKQPLPQPTPEQLADPNFFRIEDLASSSVDCAVGRWHRIVLEVSGNDLVAQVDGRPLVAVALEADSMKSRIGIGVTGREPVLIDDFRIWEGVRRPDAGKVKASLIAAPTSDAK
jgi:hypothetical protein